MPTKAFGPDGTCRVTFRLPPEAGHRTAAVVGEFNDWDPDAHPLTEQADGSMATDVDLQPGRSYRFRYLVDGGTWTNDWAADAYADNDFGGADSVVTLPLADVVHQAVPTAPATGDGFRTAVDVRRADSGGPPPVADDPPGDAPAVS